MIKLRAIRSLHFDGRQYGAGQIVSATLEQAAEILDSGRAELIDAADASAVGAAKRTAHARLCASLPVLRDFAPAAGPWVSRP